MKFSAVVLVATAAVVSAQGIADIPACAQTCLLPALQATGCSLTDFKCSCSNKSFVNDSTDCIQKACSTADQAKAAKATYELCKSAGVEIETRAPVAATTAAAPSTSAAAVATTSEAAAPTTSAAVATSSAAVVAPSSYGQAPSSVAVSSSVAAPSSYAPAPTTVVSTTVAGNSTQPTKPPAPTYTGAAVMVAGNVVLAVGGAVAAFFL
ncbi:hypothetical protein ABW20_dc0103018 [Dactylellina cionopaga]|nr:hypothetical protein ABW20_dc0103018 [Dactylellina cionopaga]